MDAQRARARSAGRGAQHAERERIRAFAEGADVRTTFTGYETTEQATAVGAIATENGQVLAKLVESPFYATGGGQVHDDGVIECEDGGCSARVVDVVRVGDDQALVLEPLTGELHEGERVIARVDPARRLTERNHTATHLLHAALRERLGTHVRQAGSYVGPDKLRFDFTHGAPLTDEELRDIEDAVNREIVPTSPCARSPPRSTRRAASARWRCSARSTATSCGWSRSVTATGRASCAAAPTCAARA